MFTIIYYPDQPENSFSVQRVVEEMERAGLRGFAIINRGDSNFDFHSSITEPIKGMTDEPSPIIQQHTDEYGDTRMGPGPIIGENSERGHQLNNNEASSHDLNIDILVNRKHGKDLSEYQKGRIRLYRDWMLAEFDNSDVNVRYITHGEKPVTEHNTAYWHYHELVDAMREQANRHGFDLVAQRRPNDPNIDLTTVREQAHLHGFDLIPQTSKRPLSDISWGKDKETTTWDLTPNHVNRAYLDLLANRFGYDLIARVDTTPNPKHGQRNRDKILSIARQLPSMIYGGRNSHDFVGRVVDNLDCARDAILSTLKDPKEREWFYEQYAPDAGQEKHGPMEDFEWPQGLLDALRRMFPDQDIREDALGFVIPGRLEQTDAAHYQDCEYAGQCDFQAIMAPTSLDGKSAFCRPCGRKI